MTPAEAAALQRRHADGWLMWFVSVEPGRAAAWAVLADQAGGVRQAGELVAGSLDELRAMLPRGLTRRERTPFMPEGVVEVWD